MEVEPLSNKSCETNEFIEKISILVVDHDVTCLSILEMMLKKWKYQVVTIGHSIDALSMLWIKRGYFDLVMVEVHMPHLNGFELQRAITQEFDLPVVLMSADGREGTMLKGLDGGAVFFMVKPISLDDLKDLWMYTILQKNKKGKNVVLKEIDKSEKSSNDKSIHEVRGSASSINKNGYQDVEKVNSKRKYAKKQGDADDYNNVDSPTSIKRAKVIWTSSLHHKFLVAILHLGFDKAVPKKILDHMQVPGLTRLNVASHLQKYRIFLRKVVDASRIQAADKSLASTAIQSDVASKRFNNVSQFHQEISLQQKFLNYYNNPNSLMGTDHGGLSPAPKARKSVSPSRLGQAELVYGEDNIVNIKAHKENQLYKANQLSTPMEANKNPIGLSVCEATSSQVGAGRFANPDNRLSGKNLLPLRTNGITMHDTLKGNLNFLRDGIVYYQRVDTEKLTNFTFLASVMDVVAKSHHDSDHCLAQEASSSVGFEGERLFHRVLSDHIDTETCMQLPSFVNNVGSGEEVGAVLDPVRKFSVFHLQPHQQQDHTGLTESAEDGVPQLHKDLSNATEKCKDE